MRRERQHIHSAQGGKRAVQALRAAGDALAYPAVEQASERVPGVWRHATARLDSRKQNGPACSPRGCRLVDVREAGAGRQGRHADAALLDAPLAADARQLPRAAAGLPRPEAVSGQVPSQERRCKPLLLGVTCACARPSMTRTASASRSSPGVQSSASGSVRPHSAALRAQPHVAHALSQPCIDVPRTVCHHAAHMSMPASDVAQSRQPRTSPECSPPMPPLPCEPSAACPEACGWAAAAAPAHAAASIGCACCDAWASPPAPPGSLVCSPAGRLPPGRGAGGWGGSGGRAASLAQPWLPARGSGASPAGGGGGGAASRGRPPEPEE